MIGRVFFEHDSATMDDDGVWSMDDDNPMASEFMNLFFSPNRESPFYHNVDSTFAFGYCAIRNLAEEFGGRAEYYKGPWTHHDVIERKKSHGNATLS